MRGVSDDRAGWLALHVLPCEPRLRSWLARRRVVDLDIDDIVQETYAVLAELDSVAHIRNPRTYVYSVAHSIILQHVHVGAGALVAAGAVVSERTKIPAGALAAGVPSRILKKELSGSALAWTESAAGHYQELREHYLKTSRVRELEHERAPQN